jgi:hypothetical protein
MHQIYIHTYVHTYNIHIHTYMYYICICMYIYICMYVYIWRYTKAGHNNMLCAHYSKRLPLCCLCKSKQFFFFRASACQSVRLTILTWRSSRSFKTADPRSGTGGEKDISPASLWFLESKCPQRLLRWSVLQSWLYVICVCPSVCVTADIRTFVRVSIGTVAGFWWHVLQYLPSCSVRASVKSPAVNNPCILMHQGAHSPHWYTSIFFFEAKNPTCSQQQHELCTKPGTLTSCEPSPQHSFITNRRRFFRLCTCEVLADAFTEPCHMLP